MRGWLAALGVAALVGATPAAAEPALVRSGQDTGQGWVFRLGQDCWVATAAHVVKSGDAAVVLGPKGAQGEALEIWRAQDGLDLALIRIAGPLALACPASSLGDRDSRPMLNAAISRGMSVGLERRMADDGGLFGTDFVAMDIIAVPETQATFTLRPKAAGMDEIAQSDSGSPVRLRGGGVGEAGLPLGLVFEVLPDGIVSAIRMDVVRGMAEALAAPKAGRTPQEAPPMELTDFTGEMPYPECGPLNIFRTERLCGWRVTKKGSENIRLALAFADPKTSFSSVTLTFAPNFEAKGVSVATRQDGQAADAWSADRYCRLASGNMLTCSVGQRTAAGLRLTFDGPRAELMSVAVE